jgi:predicted ATPase/DNA-binding SARP family transcriptional activator
MLKVWLLGQFDVQLNNASVHLASRPAQSLLAFLMQTVGTKHRREKLAEMLWPDSDDINARTNLRGAIWRINEALGEDADTGRRFIVADKIFAYFDPQTSYWLDAAVLDQAKSRPRSVNELISIVSLYRGEFLPGFNKESDEWAIRERNRLAMVHEDLLETLLRALIKEGRWNEVLEWSQRAIAQDPTREWAYCALMEYHAQRGDRASITSAYEQCAAALRKEFDAEPMAETTALYKQLLADLAGKGADEQRSKVDDRIPARQHAHTPTSEYLRTSAPLHNLPPQPTPFVGRKQELADITQRLADSECRLLSLIGAGGIGKTRLALQAAAQHLADFEDGVYFVPLASVSSIDFLAPALADNLKFSFYGQENPRAQLVDFLREKRMLIVMDNFENVLEGASLIEDILINAPNVKIMATSRERLHLQWEWIVEVEGLDYPEGDEDAQGKVEDYGAVRLFMQTARRVHPRFSLVGERPGVVRICQLVEGMPLGVELAAAWVRLLPCKEIAARIEHNLDLSSPLKDVPARQRSLRATIDYSWKLLTDEERNVFARLSVFHDGFEREAAEKVAGAPPSLLFSLMDKCFLRRTTEERFEMHNLMRQYGVEQLEQGGRADEIHARMAQYYLDFARRHQRDYAELEPEWGNLLAAMEAVHLKHAQRTVIDLAEALSEAWFTRGRYTDARLGFQWAHQAAGALGEQRLLAEYLRQHGRACIEQADYDEAAGYLTQSLQLSEQLQDLRGIANARFELGRIEAQRRNHDAADRLFSSSRLIFEEISDDSGLVNTLVALAEMRYDRRNLEEVRELCELALPKCQALGNKRAEAEVLRQLALVASERDGDYSLAQQYCERSVALCVEIQDQALLATSYFTLSQILRRSGDLAGARANAERSLELLRVLGVRKQQVHSLFQLAQVEAFSKNYEAALKLGLQSLSIYRELQDRSGVMYSLSLVGHMHSFLSQSDQAIQAWSEGLVIAETLNHPQAAVLREWLSRT